MPFIPVLFNRVPSGKFNRARPKGPDILAYSRKSRVMGKSRITGKSGSDGAVVRI